MTSVLTVTGLSIVTPTGEALLEDASFELRPGEVVLLAGPNGAGKSTLLKILAGLLATGRNGWRVSGTLGIGDDAYALDNLPATLGGYIFQDCALFDELSAGEHVAIARDHSEHDESDCRDVVETLTAGMQPSKDVHACSGGQKQRLAIARTLSSGHPLLLFDEPNSGLDLNLTRKLGALIRQVAESSHRPAIIVAHHFEHLLPAVDRVLFLGPRRRRLEETAVDRESLVERLLAVSRGQDQEEAQPEGDAAESQEEAAKRKRTRLRWFGRYFLHYFAALVFSPSVLLYGAAGSVLMGFVSTWLLFKSYPYREFLAPILHDGTVRALGAAQFRFIIPLLIAVLLAARNSAVIGADLGHRVYSSQILAMKNLSIPYRLYLFVSVALNMVIACVFFFVLGYLLCATASMYTWQFIHPHDSVALWKSLYYEHTFALFRTGWPSLGWVAVKMSASGLGIALVAAYFGFRRKTSVIDMNAAISRAIVGSTMLVLIIHSLVTVLEL